MSGQHSHSHSHSISGRDPHTGELRTLQIKDGLIAANLPGSDATEDYVTPGLVDLQVNGYGGHDLIAAGLEPETVVKLCGELAQRGVTSFLPTLITASTERLTAALETICAARQADQLAADMIAGVHMEGPSISPLDGPRGAHSLDDIRPPSLEEFESWQQVSGDLVALVTIAPEQPGASAYISELTKRGVRVAIGHSAASSQQIRSAVQAGATLSTHLGNGVAAELARHPNLLWAQLADDALSATLIADGHHLPDEFFKAAVRAKGLDRTVLVSDSVALAGMPAGTYDTAVGGKVTVEDDGRISLAGTPFLAGSGVPLIDTVPNAARMAQISLAQALDMASVNPGRLIGRPASLQVGARADVLKFSQPDRSAPLRVEQVIVAGRPTLQ